MQQFSFPYELSLKSQLTESTRVLIDAAESAAAQADENIAGYRTGAAVLLADGSVQSSSGGPQACAETSLMFLTRSEEGARVKALAIIYAGDDQQAPLLPCGACRQCILERQQLQGTPISIYIGAPDGEVIMVEDASFLLPFSEGTRNL